MAKKKPYRFALYLLLRALGGLVCVLPRPVALALARAGGRAAFWIVLRQRKKTLDHLRWAYGSEKSEAEITQLAQQVFEHLTQTGAEVLQFPKWDTALADQCVDAGEACRIYDKILAEGKGLISITAHIGNWELLAGVFGMKGYKGGVLARRIYYEPFNRWIVGLRESLGVPTIYRDDAGREILKRLERNEIVGLLPDQDIESLKGIFVPFFGRPAYTPVAPARLSIASGAPLVPNFLIRIPGNRYRLIVGEIIRPESNISREEKVKKMTEEWMRQFEKMIQAYPEQWAWMHNRWKTTAAPHPIQVGPGRGLAPLKS